MERELGSRGKQRLDKKFIKSQEHLGGKKGQVQVGHPVTGSSDSRSDAE